MIFQNLLNKPFSFILLIFLDFCGGSYGFTISVPKFEILSPRGFRVSIPDEAGIEFFAFHGAINRSIKGVEPGDFGKDIFKSDNGKWTYENTKEIIEPDDTLYYWIHVQHNQVAHQLLDRSIKISDIKDPPRDEIIAAKNDTIKLDQNSRALSDAERLQLVNQRLSSIARKNGNYEADNKDCILSQTTVNGKQVCSQSLIFEESFAYFNWTKWQRLVEIPSENEDANFVSYQDHPQNCYIVDGELHIVPTLLENAGGFNKQVVRQGSLNLGSKCTSTVDVNATCYRESGFYTILPPVVSAKLNTKNSFSFRYGQVNIRAKFPKADWVFPELLLKPLSNEYGDSLASGLIRIGFIRGNEFLRSEDKTDIDGRRLYGGAVFSSQDNLRNNWLKNKMHDEHYGSRYHTYSLVWDKDSISFAVDGEAYATFQNGFKDVFKNYRLKEAEKWQTGDKMAPFDKEFFLEVGVAAGGMSDFPDGSTTNSEQNVKPWTNFDPKAELSFWKDAKNWYQTWKNENAALEIAYIKVWAI